MQAPTVQKQGNIAPNPMAGAKQSNAPEVAFNQMLTQQIADRKSANEAGKSSQTNSSNKVNEANKADTNAPEKPAAPADATSSTEAKQADTKDETTSTTDTSAAVPVSAELMALVANHLKQAKADASDDELSTKADARISLTAGSTAADGKVQFTSQAEMKNLTKELAGKDVADKSSADFAATMTAIEETAESKQSLKLATAKLQDGVGATPQLQQTALNMTQTVAAHPTDKLTPQVGSPAWDQALGQKVVWMVAGAQQSASLTLNPPDLGPMQVVLNVTNGHAEATFTASQPEVRQALEAALPKLREMMSEAGIQLGQTTISTGMPNQQNKSGEEAGRNSRNSRQSGDSTETTSRVSASTRTVGGQGLVDTFA